MEQDIKYGQLWARHSELVEADQVGKYRVNFEGLKKAVDEAIKMQRPAGGAAWIKANERFPVKKQVIAKKFISYLNTEVVGKASSATGEMICFDWGVSSICLAIGHDELNDLEWLDESPNEQPVEQKENDAVAFAEWLDKQRNNNSPLWRDEAIWGKENPYIIVYNEYQKQNKR
jgi:hypothetical protein